MTVGGYLPAKKKTPSKGSKARTEVNVRAAKEVIAFRAKQCRKRAAVEKKLPVRRGGLGAPAGIPAKARALFGTKKTAGVLIAEGDSWFDYPLQDVLRLLAVSFLYGPDLFIS